MAVHEFGKGKKRIYKRYSVFLREFQNAVPRHFLGGRQEQEMKRWYSDNFNVEVNY